MTDGGIGQGRVGWVDNNQQPSPMDIPYRCCRAVVIVVVINGGASTQRC